MSFLRLAICIIGIYTCFLTWGITQERISTSRYAGHYPGQSEKFTATIFLNTFQSSISALASLIYIYASSPHRKEGWRAILGLPPRVSARPQKPMTSNSSQKGDLKPSPPHKSAANLISRIAQVALLQSISSPFGYASLKHISYPTMTLGKSCKLVPVLLMNGLLYRRHFKAYKYAVVLMVTAGVTMFMLYGKAGSGKRDAAEDSMIGLALLMVNLMLDGVTNSTQDDIFATQKISGVQMMFWMNILSTLMTTCYMLNPYPDTAGAVADFASSIIGISYHHVKNQDNELIQALHFISRHPKALNDIALFSLCGAVGQLFIFTTLQHFGSLTLVMVTVTRKLFTMLLSISYFGHELSQGQWMGVTVVFAGLSLEALFGIKSGEKTKLEKGQLERIPANEPSTAQSNGHPKGAESAVFLQSEELPDNSIFIQGPDFSKKLSLSQLMESYERIGFQASGLARAIEITRHMKAWRLSDDPPTDSEPDEYLVEATRAKTKATIFLGYTSNLISSGLREIFCYLAANSHVGVIVTTAGGVEEDLIKCLGPTILGDFNLDGSGLRKKGMNRIGNLIVPNDNYCKFEDWLTPILDEMVEEQTTSGIVWTPSKIIRRLGQRINDERSVLYQAYKNNIPIFCPALTDGSLGDMIYFHSYRKPGLVIDIAQDIRAINDIAVSARKTGMIILGGGVVKHHIANANLMRNGADWTVYINTASEFDGSDAGARPDEAVSWGKIKAGSESVKVHADATLVFPLLVAQTFARD